MGTEQVLVLVYYHAFPRLIFLRSIVMMIEVAIHFISRRMNIIIFTWRFKLKHPPPHVYSSKDLSLKPPQDFLLRVLPTSKCFSSPRNLVHLITPSNPLNSSHKFQALEVIMPVSTMRRRRRNSTCHLHHSLASKAMAI